ncbi:MAG TPA: radical SAM protein [Armatimonadota bacterium]|nr:radical SAM protein [Armatimonadota bacterium]
MHLTLHLTASCNLRCRYCYATGRDKGTMTLDTARAAIALGMAELRKKDAKASLGVIFFGGEPLLQRELIREIVRHCRTLEAASGQVFHFKIITNGTLLDEAFLTDPDTREIFVAFSHDGVEAAHDANRVDAEGRGTFAQLSPTMALLLRHKPYAPTMLVVTPHTVRHYADSVAYLFDRGVRYLICSLDYSGAWDAATLKELERQYKTLAAWYARLTLAEEKFYFSPFEVKIASHIYPGSCRSDRCELGQRQVSVAPDGRLYPCVQFVGDADYGIGDVHAGLDEAARRRLYTLNAEEKAECAACAVRERCNHFCGCLNRQATGRLDRVSPVLCAHERIVLPIADRLAARLYQQRSAMFIQKHYNALFPLLSLVEDRTTGIGQ